MATFDNTLGALFIGYSVSTLLYGILLLQIYNYYRRYPSDKVRYKALVALLLLSETAHEALIGHCVYYYTVTHFRDVHVLLERVVWSMVFQLPVGAVIGNIVRFFFVMRVWRFSKGNVWLTVILLFLDFMQLAASVLYTIKCYNLPASPDLTHLRILGSIALGIGIVDDIGIAGALCYYLQGMRSGYTEANPLVRRLTLNAINTGMLTSAMSFSTLITYNLMPTNFIFVGCYFVLSKLYPLSFVAALNTRQIIRGRGTDKKSSISTDEPSRLFTIPLHSIMVTTDPPHVVSCRGEENHFSIPFSGNGLMQTLNRSRYPVIGNAF